MIGAVIIAVLKEWELQYIDPRNGGYDRQTYRISPVGSAAAHGGNKVSVAGENRAARRGNNFSAMMKQSHSKRIGHPITIKREILNPDTIDERDQTKIAAALARLSDFRYPIREDVSVVGREVRTIGIAAAKARYTIYMDVWLIGGVFIP
jgi:hypothetical protein